VKMELRVPEVGLKRKDGLKRPLSSVAEPADEDWWQSICDLLE
jgi:hypothetical protein